MGSAEAGGERVGFEAQPEATREVRHEYTLNWAPILRHLGASVLVSTYQAGKLVAVSAGKGVDEGGLALSYHNFERAMGIAVGKGRIAVGTKSAVWVLYDAPSIAPQLEPAGERDGCYLTRIAHHTGEIQGHEMAWSGETLWVVNTLFSCLCTLDGRHSFVPRWRPRFIDQYAAEDRCHLNGMAMADGQPRYVTVMGETNERGGWRPGKVDGGCVIDVATGETVIRGLAMPHSPRLHGGQLWLLDSGTGRLLVGDPASGRVETVVTLPGYTRGLALLDRFAFVGLSRIRETSTFGGVPIAADRDALKCGVAVVDLAAGERIGLLEFHSGVEEIFDVQVLPQRRWPVIAGPHPDLDGQAPIWLAGQAPG